MPRKTLSQRTGHSQKILHQPSSQITLEQSFGKSSQLEDVDELINNCVRYIIYRAGNNLPIRRTDIQKQVLHNVGRNFDQIIRKVTEILRNVYGYDMYLREDGGSSKLYLVGNALPYRQGTDIAQPELIEGETVPADVQKILIMLVLSHVFMSNSSVSEASIFSFLRAVQIDPDERHEIFGNVKDFVTSAMVKQKYLKAEVDQITRRASYTWGSRADHEISKHELLKFVCKMYKDRTPRSWSSQFESAQAQNAQGLQNGVQETEAEEVSD